MASSLGLSEEMLTIMEDRISYFGLLHGLETLPYDLLPTTQNSKVLLKGDERAFFTAPANLLEERVIDRKIVGGSHGVSIRLMKGISYRVGQSRGRLESTTGIVPISFGDFTVTSQRLVFSGDRKSVNAPFDKLQNLELFSDGLRFSLTGRQKPVTIQFGAPEAAEVAGIYISRILNG